MIDPHTSRLLVEHSPKHPEYKTINKEERQKSQRVRLYLGHIKECLKLLPLQHLTEAFKAAEDLKKKLEIEFEVDAVRRLKVTISLFA